MELYLFNSNTILFPPYKNVLNFRIALSQKMKIVTYRVLLLAFVYSEFNVQELYIDINMPATFFCLSVLYWSKWKSLIRQRTSSRGNYSTGFNILCVFGEFQRRPDLRYTSRPDLNLFDCSVLLFLPVFFSFFAGGPTPDPPVSPSIPLPRIFLFLFFFLHRNSSFKYTSPFSFVRVLFGYLGPSLFPAAFVLHDLSKTSLYRQLFHVPLTAVSPALFSFTHARRMRRSWCEVSAVFRYFSTTVALVLIWKVVEL